MKRIIPIVALVSVMAACNSKPDPATVQSQQQTTTSLTAEDSLVLSQFRAWKAENELRDAREFLNGEEGESMTSTSSNAARKTTTTRSSGTRTSTSSGTANTSTASTRKKGWSSAAKGAVIGGVAGAAGGAIINKRNRAAGAVVGGILGAGVGYGIGRSKDVKDGRY